VPPSLILASTRLGFLLAASCAFPTGTPEWSVTGSAPWRLLDDRKATPDVDLVALLPAAKRQGRSVMSLMSRWSSAMADPARRSCRECGASPRRHPGARDRGTKRQGSESAPLLLATECDAPNLPWRSTQVCDATGSTRLDAPPRGQTRHAFRISTLISAKRRDKHCVPCPCCPRGGAPRPPSDVASLPFSLRHGSSPASLWPRHQPGDVPIESAPA
jgi:hypothetical protein